jgi:hypothetical protein
MLRAIFDLLDAEKNGYIEIQALLNLWTEHGMSSLPQRMQTELAPRAEERLTFEEFVAAVSIANVSQPGSAPATPDVSRLRRPSVGRQPRQSVSMAADMSPLIVSAGVSMLNSETASLRAKLANTQIEIQHLKASLRMAEETALRSTELAEEQVLQAEENFRNAKVCFNALQHSESFYVILSPCHGNCL